MNGTFNGQILVDKLAKLNNSQQSIETLSHWCIFHRKKAKQVVETWDRQFHCSPLDQRVSFLYLANDILQNSRRKGSEFVAEFWKVLPDALNDVMENGDEFGRSAALRLVDIWEDRKVFGSRGQTLKEELLGRNLESKNRNGKVSNNKPKQPIGDMLEKLISSYEQIYDGPVDEDALFSKCQDKRQDAINCVEKVEKEIGSDFNSGNLSGSGVAEELHGQRIILRECIEQLKAVGSSRATLVSQLREALHEQEFKIEQVNNQLQATQSRYEQVDNICQRISCNSGHLLPEQRLKEAPAFYDVPPIYSPEAPAGTGDREQSTPVRYIQQGPFADNSSHTEGEHRKTAAAAVAAKLTASTSSAQMLSYVLSSLASEGVIGQSAKEDYSSDNKRPKLENGVSSYMQPPLPPFPHPDSLHQPPPQPPPQSSPMMHLGPTMQAPPLPPTMPPMPPPPPLSQFVQAAGSMTGVPYSYGSAPLQRPPILYPMVGMSPYPNPPNPYQNFQTSEGVGLFSQPPLRATSPPISRQ